LSFFVLAGSFHSYLSFTRNSAFNTLALLSTPLPITIIVFNTYCNHLTHITFYFALQQFLFSVLSIFWARLSGGARSTTLVFSLVVVIEKEKKVGEIVVLFRVVFSP